MNEALAARDLSNREGGEQGGALSTRFGKVFLHIRSIPLGPSRAAKGAFKRRCDNKARMAELP